MAQLGSYRIVPLTALLSLVLRCTRSNGAGNPARNNCLKKEPYKSMCQWKSTVDFPSGQCVGKQAEVQELTTKVPDTAAAACDARNVAGNPAKQICLTRAPYHTNCAWMQTAIYPKGQCVPKPRVTAADTTTATSTTTRTTETTSTSATNTTTTTRTTTAVTELPTEAPTASGACSILSTTGGDETCPTLRKGVSANDACRAGYYVGVSKLEQIKAVRMWDECAGKCSQHAECRYWLVSPSSSKGCFLYAKKGAAFRSSNSFSGFGECESETTTAVTELPTEAPTASGACSILSTTGGDETCPTLRKGVSANDACRAGYYVGVSKLEQIKAVRMWDECAGKCSQHAECRYWLVSPSSSKGCFLYAKKGAAFRSSNSFSGFGECESEPATPTAEANAPPFCDLRNKAGNPARQLCQSKEPYKTACMWAATAAYPAGQCVERDGSISVTAAPPLVVDPSSVNCDVSSVERDVLPKCTDFVCFDSIRSF